MRVVKDLMLCLHCPSNVQDRFVTGIVLIFNGYYYIFNAMLFSPFMPA